MEHLELTDEQSEFLERAAKGESVLVDACWGSGKTTAIQSLVPILENQGKKFLYLTYNTLLKQDARKKIQTPKGIVTNYDSYAYRCLMRAHIPIPGIDRLIAQFNENMPPVDPVDVLILDEYQDMKSPYTPMLEAILNVSPNLQMVAVGDMAQKVYKTKLDSAAFIHDYMERGGHTTTKMAFTQSFRLGPDIANLMSEAFEKPIQSMNKTGKAETHDLDWVVDFLLSGEVDPKDVIVLGQKHGIMSQVLNRLSKRQPENFNKSTVWANNEDRGWMPKDLSQAMIMTTFEGSKGMEKPIAIVCNWTEGYWRTRNSCADANPMIVRNVFGVAATRGKDLTIFLKPKALKQIHIETLRNVTEENDNYDFGKVSISKAFSYKYDSDVNDLINTLELTQLVPDRPYNHIHIKNHDGMIDLSPVINIYQKAFFFENFDIDEYIKHAAEAEHKTERLLPLPRLTLPEKLLLLASIETGYERYTTEVTIPFVTNEEDKALHDRLSSRLSTENETQIPLHIKFPFKKKSDHLELQGYADVLDDDGIIWSLKFKDGLGREDFLELATYVAGLGAEEGRLWNTRTNELWQVKVPNNKKFLKETLTCLTMGKRGPEDLKKEPIAT